MSQAGERVLGVDVARGAALMGMMAVHAFPLLDDDGAPTAAALVAAGRSAATFVLVAGVGLAFVSGGARPVQGRERTAVAAGIAVRAALIGALGLVLGLFSQLNEVAGILPFYGLLFLLAIPLLGRSPLVPAGVAVAAIALGPILIVATADAGLPYTGADGDPTPATLVGDPLGLLVQLTVTGTYPVVVYLAYLCAGLAIGRLDLRSRRVAWWLVGIGAALAVTSRVVSAIVLHPLGGLARLVSQAASGDIPDEAARSLLWEPEPSSSWWYLALPAPHSHTTVDVTHTLGSAMAVLGAALLLTRIPAVARPLRPLAVAGTMALTLYSAHLLVLATGVLHDQPALLYLLMVACALTFALLWRRWLGQGPLERIVAAAARRARRIAADVLATSPSTTPEPVVRAVVRNRSRLVGPVTVVAAFAVVFWAGSRLVPPAPPHDHPAVAHGAAPETAGRYCDLSQQVGVIDERYADEPEVIVEKAGPQLDLLVQVAPVQIRSAVSTTVEHRRAEADLPTLISPDDATVEQAETTIDAFEETNC